MTRLHPALSLFGELTSLPTAPFFEHGPTTKALAWIRGNLGAKVRVSRSRGGLAVRYEGAGRGAPALCLAAHLDHPAFHLGGVTAKGATAALQGGLVRELLPGTVVEAFPARPSSNAPLARGVLGAPSGKDGMRFPVRWTEPPARGARLAFAVPELTPFSIDGGWLASRSIDDLLGAAVSLETLRRAVRARLRTNLTVLLHRAEEVGFIGALALIADGAVSVEDSILSIETSKRLPDAKAGGGPVIRTGDKATLFDPNLLGLLDCAAAGLRRRGGRVQRTRLIGGTCEATAYLAFGYEAAGVAIPLVNYHNGGGGWWDGERPGKVEPEKVRVSDAEGSVDLLLEAARLFPGSTLRGTLRRRLTARLEQSEGGLA